MTLFQVNKVRVLKESGWSIVPPQLPARPGGTIKVKNQTGDIFDILGDGNLKKVENYETS
jgi:hypothetical protein